MGNRYIDKYISEKEKNNYIDIDIKENNKIFIKNKKQEYKKYFDEMFCEIDSNIFLDEEQREAILTDEDYVLIVAGAGSGKTTTITAKVRYLIDKLNINPNEILVISFTNKAVLELKERINNKFNLRVPILTFHKLGLKIIREFDSNIRISNDIYMIIKEYINNNKNKDINKYFNSYFDNDSLNKEKYCDKFIELCIIFIKIFKTKGYGNFDLLNKNCSKRNSVFLDYIEKLYNYYQQKLKDNNYIDFEDMVNLSYKVLKEEKISINYKYIIVDEYQDISNQRFNLISIISKKTDAKIIAVGDDWQSIYAFAGSEISLFTEFKKNMNNGILLQITNTYRNSQQLIDIAGKFIMKNNNQIKKKLKSNKKIKNPVEIIFYNDGFNKLNNLKHGINKCIKDNKLHNVALLSRYKFDLEKIYNRNDIEYLTVHSSKGLGFNNVIIINMNDDIYGFPSKIKNDEIFKIFNLSKDDYIFSEERRLFYVALTRTKNKVYIFVPKSNPSIFINEIVNYKNVKLNRKIINYYFCPICGQRLIKKNILSKIYICNNSKNNCCYNLTINKNPHKNIN